MVHLRRLLRFVVLMALIPAVLAGAVLALAPQARTLVSAHRSDHERITLGPLAEPSIVYDRHGKRLVTLIDAQNTNRSQVRLAQVPETLKGSVIAVEDEHFYRHTGINVRSIIRAASTNIDTGRISQGGSTITQQLVKNSLVGNKRNFSRKIREAVLSLELEKQMTKDQILERYLNTVYFGNGAYGVQAAARVYFDKDVRTLNWAEGALLAALIRNPRQYNPFRYQKVALTRRSLVFRRLVETGRLTAGEVKMYEFSPLPTTPTQPRQVDDYFVDIVKHQLQTDDSFGLGTTYAARTRAAFQGGLRVFTTYDPGAQLLALAARNQTVQTVPAGRPDGTFPLSGINRVTGEPNFGTQAMVSIQPSSGAVRVLVGGPGFDKYKYNLATQNRPQPGSSMKTFVLAALFESGYVPDDLVSGDTYVIRQPLQEDKVVEGSAGVDTITGQTERSSNPAFIRLGQVIGVPKVIAMAKRFGIPEFLPRPVDANGEPSPGRPISALPNVPTLPLGVGSISPFDMASAYAALAHDGVRNPPYFIERIEDRSGKVLYQHRAAPERVVQAQTARLVTQVLVANVESGTGTRAQLANGQPAAGKTGTTNENRAVWFVGYTPKLATAIWMGNAGDPISMTFAGGATGGKFPAATWGNYMNALIGKSRVSPFPKPQPTRDGVLLQPPEGLFLGTPFVPLTGLAPDPAVTPVLPTTPGQTVPLPPPQTTPGGTLPYVPAPQPTYLSPSPP